MSMLGCTRFMTTPSSRTRAGRRLMTWSMRFLTLTTASLGFASSRKTTWIVASPALVASEIMYVMPGTPLIARSSVMIDDRTSTSALAPGNVRETMTRGGEISGNCEIGRVRIASTPRKTIITDRMIASTGRWMNLVVRPPPSLGELIRPVPRGARGGTWAA